MARPSRTPAKPASRRALWLERALPIGLLGVALVGAPLMIFSGDGLPRLEAVELEMTTVERENAELRREIDLLRARVARLRDDPAAVEQLARDELGQLPHGLRGRRGGFRRVPRPGERGQPRLSRG
jgi:cell division protein FtsB